MGANKAVLISNIAIFLLNTNNAEFWFTEYFERHMNKLLMQLQFDALDNIFNFKALPNNI